MSCYITITNITGEPPYEITVCDNNGNNCFLSYYGLDYVPPVIYVDIPSDWSLLPFVQVTVQSSDGCEELEFIQTTPTVTPTNTPTPSVTVTATVTPSLGTSTPTPTVTRTPTITPTTTITPSITQSNTPTKSVTPSVTQTISPSAQSPTPTPTITQTPTITPTITPSSSPPVPPYFEVQNINGLNPLKVYNSVYNSSVGQSSQYVVNFGDGTIYTRSLPNPPYTGASYTLESNTYAAGTFISKFSNFSYNSVLNSDSLLGVIVGQASDIISNIYTFSAFTSLSDIYISASTINDFQHNLPSKINNFTYNYNTATTLTFSIPNTSSYQHFTGSSSSLVFTNNTSLTSLTINISGITQNLKPDSIRVQNNSSLQNLNFYVPTKGRDFFLFNNSNLTNINFLPSLSSATTANDFRFNGNKFSAWTYNFPSSATDIYLYSQSGGLTSGPLSFKTFGTDLTNLTNLDSLKLYSNSLTSLTQTISACTSLTNLEIYRNRLTTLPPILPNSIETFNFQNNMITGYTANIPTNIVSFEADSTAAGYQNNFNPWTIDLTGYTSLTTFGMGGTMLTGWTVQFPQSITTIRLNNNYLTDVNLNLFSGVTDLYLQSNTLTGVTNASLNNTIEYINLSSNYFYNSLNIFTANTPTTLQTFYCQSNNLLTGWTTSFSSSTNLNYINFAQSNLNTTSVDYILSDIRYNNSLNNGTLILSGVTGKPASPTGGILNADYLALIGPPRNWTVGIKP